MTIQELKCAIFDLMRQQSRLQDSFNQLEQQKQALLRELTKLEIKEKKDGGE